MVLCDDGESFVAARSLIVAGCMNVDVGKAMGFVEALSWIKDLGLSHVLLEGDSKVVIDAIVLFPRFHRLGITLLLVNL
ncbi:hypothetical protein ACS0TY_005280 [Phlomoides rotata]